MVLKWLQQLFRRSTLRLAIVSRTRRMSNQRSRKSKLSRSSSHLKMNQKTLKKFWFKVGQALQWSSRLDFDLKLTNNSRSRPKLSKERPTSLNCTMISRKNLKRGLSVEKFTLQSRKTRLRKWILCKHLKASTSTLKISFLDKSTLTLSIMQSWSLTVQPHGFHSTWALLNQCRTLFKASGHF